MKTPDLFWLTVTIQVQNLFILVGVLMFLTLPKQGRREFKYLGAYLIVALLTEVTAAAGYHLFHKSINIVNNVADFFYLTLIVLLFKDRIPWKNIDAFAYLMIILYLVFGLSNLFFVQGFQNMNSYTWTVSNICIIAVCLSYFYVLIKQLPTESVTSLPMFWIASALLIYTSGTCIVYLSTDYLINVLKSNLVAPSYFNVAAGLVFYSMLWHALLLIRSQHKQKRTA